MLYNKNNLNVAKIASTSDLKPELASVLFTKNGTVATDAVCLLEVSTDEGLKVEDYPKVDKATAMQGCKPFMANAKQLKEIKIPSNKALPVLESVAIKHIDDKSIEFLTTDLEMAKTTRVVRTVGSYPEYKQIIPTGKPVASVKINGKLLKNLLDVMTGVDEQIEIKFFGAEKPLVLEGQSKSQTTKGLLMPIRE